MDWSWMVGRSGWISASPSAHTRPPLACTWADPQMPVTDSGEIVAGETAEDEAEAEEAGGTSEGATLEVDLPATMMMFVARHRATTMTEDRLPGTMMTATLLPWTGMLTATVLPRLVTTMTAVRHLGTTMTAMAAAAAAAAEEEADITRRGHMTEGEVWTVTLAVGPRGTTALGTHTGMTGTVARATGQGGLAPPAHSTGIPGRGGITEAEAGAMRGHQDLHCLQDQLWLQDTERRMHSQEIK